MLLLLWIFFYSSSFCCEHAFGHLPSNWGPKKTEGSAYSTCPAYSSELKTWLYDMLLSVHYSLLMCSRLPPRPTIYVSARQHKVLRRMLQDIFKDGTVAAFQKPRLCVVIYIYILLLTLWSRLQPAERWCCRPDAMLTPAAATFRRAGDDIPADMSTVIELSTSWTLHLAPKSQPKHAKTIKTSKNHLGELERHKRICITAKGKASMVGVQLNKQYADQISRAFWAGQTPRPHAAPSCQLQYYRRYEFLQFQSFKAKTILSNAHSENKAPCRQSRPRYAPYPYHQSKMQSKWILPWDQKNLCLGPWATWSKPMKKCQRFEPVLGSPVEVAVQPSTSQCLSSDPVLQSRRTPV